MFQNLKNRFIDGFQFINISGLRFALKFSDKAFFQFILNNLPSLKEGTKEICKWYKRQGVDLSHLSEATTRT